MNIWVFVNVFRLSSQVPPVTLMIDWCCLFCPKLCSNGSAFNLFCICFDYCRKCIIIKSIIRSSVFQQSYVVSICKGDASVLEVYGF